MYKLVMICLILSFNLSAMNGQLPSAQYHPQQHEQDHIFILLQNLVQPDNNNSIIIFPAKTSYVKDEAPNRKNSEKILSEIVLNGVRVCLHLENATRGKSFLVIDNKVDNYEANPACSQAIVCKEINDTVSKQEINLDSTFSYEASFIVYNMPYYNQNAGCFDWAYGESLRDLLCYRKEPCLVVIDEDIHNKIDAIDEIYRRFYGKKKVLQYDRKLQSLTEYKPSFWNEIPFPIVMGWAALISIGLYYTMPSGLATALDANF